MAENKNEWIDVPLSDDDMWEDVPLDDTPKESLINTAITKSAAGASFGFDDEFSGALSALGKAVGIDNLGGRIKEIKLSDEGPTLDIETLRKAYRDQQQATEALKQKMNQDNPITATGFEVAGSMLIPGSTAKTLTGKALTNAGQAALSGVGNTGANADFADYVNNAMVNASLGAGFTLAGPAISKVKDSIPEAMDFVTKKIGKGVFGVDEKATELYLKNRNAVNNAPTMGEIAESVLNKSDETSAINELRKKTSEFSDEAWKTLDKSRFTPRDEVLDAISNLQDELLVNGSTVGQAQERAYRNLDSLRKQIVEQPSQLSEPTLKKIIQSLDENINYNNPELGPSNTAFKNLRQFVDNRLKTQNTDYAKAMEETAYATNSLKEVESVFQNRQNKDNYDKFAKSVKNLVNKDQNSAANRAVDKIEELTKYDLRSDISNAWAKEQFAKGDINGSRKTLLGGIVGGAAGSGGGFVGGLLGGAIGGSIGFTADKFSGPIFKRLLDGKLNSQEFVQKLAPKLGKYAAPISNAAARGNTSLASTVFIMQQQDPEFRKLFNELNSDEEE